MVVKNMYIIFLIDLSIISAINFPGQFHLYFDTHLKMRF